jgi:hypothetical protein
VDNFESGTLPVLEAMLCGVPVLARPVGHIPDLYNGENMVMLDGESDDVLGIQEKLLEMIGDKKRLTQLHDNGWQTAKVRSFERRAYMYQQLYRSTLHPSEIPVSVVVPIFDRQDIIRKCLSAVAGQTHKNIELIVADDMSPVMNKDLVMDFARYVNFPVRYINIATKKYGLAKARNIATIEATGEVIVYCDQRMIMDSNAVSEFLKYLKPKTWLFGNKGSSKTEFVENFSCVNRKDIINAGMFCERIDRYGGMSQECRTRFRNQGGRTEYVASAVAVPTGKSSNRNRKRQDIIASKNKLWKMYDA